MPPLSPGTLQRLERLFTGADRARARGLLEAQCGTNLPLLERPDDVRIERCRRAALKLSGGDYARLEEAVRLACIDWRDLLMAAGFGHDTEAHLHWMPPARKG
jgi:hypothetical protein